MTEPDDQAAAQEQLDRIARLRERKSPSTRRRSHTARDSRIVAAGLGAGAMFGIVTLLGLDYSATQADTADTSTTFASTVAPPVEVRIHRVDPTKSPAKKQTKNWAASRTKKSDATTEKVVAAGPIELTANPVVRTVTVAAPAPTNASTATAAASAPQPAPAATTSGSS